MAFTPIEENAPNLDGPGVANSFLGLDSQFASYDRARFVILPVAFDQSSSYQRGSDKGPAAIIEASRYLEAYDIETDTEAYRDGIHTSSAISTSSFDEMANSVMRRIKECLQDNKTMATLGGEHAISKPAIQAHGEHFGSLSVLQLDAHTDLRDQYEGNPNSHASVMARVKELPYVDRLVAVGIRSMEKGERSRVDDDSTFFAHAIHTDNSWMDRAISLLSENVYLTFDLDVFNPAIMPSTGTPEPGGLDWWTTLNFLRKVIKARNLVGFDVVELCPMENIASDFTAAKLVYTIFSYLCEKQ